MHIKEIQDAKEEPGEAKEVGSAEVAPKEAKPEENKEDNV